MINKLQRFIVQTDSDGTQVSKLPSSEDMMKKINEIIDYVNKHEINIEDQKFKDLFKPRKLK